MLKGIVFDQTLAGEYILNLAEDPGTVPDEIVLDAKLSSENTTGKIQYHYSAQITLVTRLPEPPQHTFDLASFGDSSEEVSCYRDGSLFHGPTFQGVQKVLQLGSNGLIMACKLQPISDRQQGQFPVHTLNPYAADVQFQSMVIWSRHTYGAGSLPLSCGYGEQFRTVPFGQPFYVSMKVASSTESGLTASIVTHDELGIIFNRIAEAEVTISKRLNPLFQQNQPLK